MRPYLAVIHGRQRPRIENFDPLLRRLERRREALQSSLCRGGKTVSNPADAAPIDSVMNLIFGRWRSQSLYAGVKLGIFEVLHSAEEETPGP